MGYVQDVDGVMCIPGTIHISFSYQPRRVTDRLGSKACDLIITHAFLLDRVDDVIRSSTVMACLRHDRGLAMQSERHCPVPAAKYRTDGNTHTHTHSLVSSSHHQDARKEEKQSRAPRWGPKRERGTRLDGRTKPQGEKGRESPR